MSKLEILHYVKLLLKFNEDMALNIVSDYGIHFLLWKEIFWLIQQQCNDSNTIEEFYVPLSNNKLTKAQGPELGFA